MESRIKGNYSSQYRIRKSTLAITFIIMAFSCSVLMGSTFHKDHSIIIQNFNEPTIKTSAGTIPDFFYCNKTITIDHNKVNGTEDLENFPVLISLLDEDLHYFTQPDGDDIAFYQGSTLLDHEIELYNQSYNNTHAQLIAWVRIPLLSTSVDTVIILYFGNTTITNFENPDGVWGSDYKGVWHLGEYDETIAYDSTINAFHGSHEGDPTPQEGKIGKAQFFDGDGDWIDTGQNASDFGIEGNNSKTVSAWVNTSAFERGGIFDVGARVDRQEFCLRAETSMVDYWKIQLWGAGEVGNILYNSKFKWVFFTMSYDGSMVRLYADGREIKNTAVSLITTDEISFRIARYWYSFFNGTIDEVRVSNNNRSAEWIATEYNNQNDPDNFYSISPLVEAAPPSTSISFNTVNPSYLNGTDLITLTPVDHFQGSGINHTSFRINESSWMNYTGPFDLSNGSYNEGNYTIDYYSVANDNHVEPNNTHAFYLDKTIPTCSINYEYWEVPGNASTSTLFPINVTENGSGLDKIYYNVDNLPWEVYTGKFTLFGHNEGEHAIYYYCVDKAGNREEINNLVVMLVEAPPPSTSISINTVNPSYLNGTDLITLTPVDHFQGSGINHTSFRINGESWMNYTCPFDLSNGTYNEGNYTIDYYSVNNDNLTESFNTRAFYLDKTIPTCFIYYNYGQTPGNVSSSTLFTIDVIETGSGIDKIYYKVDNLPWEVYTGKFNLIGQAEGELTIYYYCVDKAGNKGEINSLEVIYTITTITTVPPDFMGILIMSLFIGVIAGSLFVGVIYRKKSKSANIKIINPKRKSDKIGKMYRSRDSLMSLTSKCINAIISKYGDEIDVRFYSNPKIYPYSQKSTDGLILNDQGFLLERITHSKSGGVELAKELNLKPKIGKQVKALQILYTNDISERNIMDKCETYHLPDTILSIVGLTWPQYQYERTFDFFNSKKYDGIVKIISLELFAELLDLKKKQKKQIEHVLGLYNESNKDALKDFSESIKGSIHDSNDLRDYLKSKGLIIETFQDFFIPSESTPVIIHVNIHVTCPTCKKTKHIEIPKNLINDSKPVNTIDIPKYLICNHHFQAFIDKNLAVRGYQKVDIDLDQDSE